ncbi:MAG TPA: pyruvate dehydrogenase, partial [Spirochaetia bacterium]|nr:pyruvate dehydrogenase [Spirochaetia bacterium]
FNHSALLSRAGMESLRETLGIPRGVTFEGFEPDSEEGRWCRRSAMRLGLGDEARLSSPAASAAGAKPARSRGLPQGLPVCAADVPYGLPGPDRPLDVTSTQEALGRALVRLEGLPKVGERIVTSSPDVSVSTGLATWINTVGRFCLRPVTDFEAGRPKILDWRASERGRHIELGISEMNLFTLLGQLGLSHEMNGQLLFPVGTLYDPFVCRGLDALIFGLYSGSRFIFAGTPSGVSLAPEGGAHQSSVTAALGMELPGLDYFEPCFARETEWALLEGLRGCCDREGGRSTYLRLSTKPVDQRLMEPALARWGVDGVREAALAGGYVLREAGDAALGRGAPLVHLVSCGAMIPEAIAAAEYLEREGVAANVIHLVSPRRARESWQSRAGSEDHVMARLIPPAQRRAPIVTVQDGAASALSWVGGVFGQPTTPLGVCRFGQSGLRQDLYRSMHIDVDSILCAAFEAVERSGS